MFHSGRDPITSFAARTSVALAICFAFHPSDSTAQQLSEVPFPSSQQAGEKDPTPTIDPELRPQIDQWIEELGSNEFAVRERAASRLAEIGLPIVPLLRQLAARSEDAEVRLRAKQIVHQLSRGDMQARIESFLAGEEVGFEGWEVIRAFFGDTGGARELFVELMKRHPTLTASLSGEPRDRALAMDAVMNRIDHAMTVERRFANRADAFALVLPAVDPKVPINASYEAMLLNVLNQNAVSQIRDDAQLAGPFKLLVSRWMLRSTLGSRNSVLQLGMQHDLDVTLPLAIQTLSESNETGTIAGALQAISRFGNRRHAQLVKPLLDDTRPSLERGFARGARVRTQLGDVAMVTIAILHELPLSELGLDNVMVHPAIGFSLDDVGFPEDEKEKRAAARAKIDKLLEEEPVAEGS